MVKLSDNALQICKSRYFMEGENEDWEKCTYRVADHISNAEANKQKYKDKFHEKMHNMEFIPAGRIIRNSGRTRGSLFNCYCLSVEDNMRSILQTQMDAGLIASSGGGCGFNFSPLRPRGDRVNGPGGETSGPVSFLKAYDALAATIQTGGARRSANLCCLDVTHPDIEEFLDAKLKDGVLPHFNISVNITNEFLERVEADKDIDLKFNQRVYKTVKAKYLWDKLVKNMLNSAEPGLLNTSNLYRNNSYSFDPIIGVNPCLSGDTKILVADGRGHVSIKQLAEEGKDIPVFSIGKSTRGNPKVEIKMMRHPRITGYNQPIYKVILNDSSSVRCTGNHKFIMLNGDEKEAKDLKAGDRLLHPTRFCASMKEIIKTANCDSSDYWWLKTGVTTTNTLEHRIKAAYKYKKTLKCGEVIHHKDFNSLNNSFDNLELMTRQEHCALHGDHIKGDNNPMRRFPEKNWLIKQNWGGINNGRYKGYTPEDIFKLAMRYTQQYGRRLTKDEWRTICKDNGYPWSKYSFGEHRRASKMLAAASKQVGMYLSGGGLRIYRELELAGKLTDLPIKFVNGQVHVERVCEFCGCKFTVLFAKREQSFCSIKCSNKVYAKASTDTSQLRLKKSQTLLKSLDTSKIVGEIKFDNDNLLRVEKECLYCCTKFDVQPCRANRKFCTSACSNRYYNSRRKKSNYKVVSIELDGYEDVYNGTVDDNHNYMIFTSEGVTDSQKTLYNYVVTRQCGEAVLGAQNSCVLASLVLPKFITATGKTNWKQLEEAVYYAVRFLDDVIDMEQYILPGVEEKTKNSRRIGLGYMGLAEYLFEKQLRYGSKESIEEVEKLAKNIRNFTYLTLVELAKEKGSFPKFDTAQYGKADFIRALPAAIRKDIKKYGSRCVTGLSIAPTGTVALVADVTGGIEPLFAKAYLRKDRVSERMYINDYYNRQIHNGKLTELPNWLVDSYDLKPEDHFEVQSIVTKYTCGGVSKTVNLPKETTSEQLSDLLLEYAYDLKGVTVYRDGSKKGQVLNRISHDEVLEYMKNNGKTTNDQTEEQTTKCRSGICEL